MTLKRMLLTLVVLLVLTILLLLDLTYQGLAWRVFWHLTGEETPASQIIGMVDWAGNLIRVQPDTAPDIAINHTTQNPYGINVFLQQEVEPEKRERIMQMISEAGFTWIRQQFPWEDIEIHGRGDFSDRRNDYDGDGSPDEISAWDKYDQIVSLAQQYDIEILARLDNPPSWTRSNPDSGDFAPPDDLQDFVNYARAVAERYKGRIRYYQVWNEPNIYPEWGNQEVSPEAYTDLLCQTYAALKAVDPDSVVISGALAPTIALDGRNLSDIIYLQRMYDAGATGCFDVLAVQGYGFNSGPTDRRLRVTNVNFGHNVYIRDVMVANGDAQTPIWITEAAWNAQPRDAALVTTLYGNYGIVTEEQAARYMPQGYQRAQEEWPWVGPIFYWFFKRPADYEINQSWYYFRMAEPDFTPLPVYDSMKQYITTQQPTLYPGVHQVEHWAITRPDDAAILPDESAAFGQAVRTSSLTFNISSHYDVWVRWKPAEDTPPLIPYAYTDDDGWNITHLAAQDIFPNGDTVETRFSDANTALIVDSVRVADRTYARLYPLLGAVGVVLGMLALVIGQAWWQRHR